MWNQFLSSDENDREDDYPHENGEDEVGGDASDGSTDTESHGEMVVSPRNKITKMRQKNDVKKLNDLCEVGKFLSLQIQSTSREGPQTRNSLWRSASKSEPAVDVSLEASLNYFTEFCYLQTFKVMTDLLKYAGESMDIFKKVFHVLYHIYLQNLHIGCEFISLFVECYLVPSSTIEKQTIVIT